MSSLHSSRLLAFGLAALLIAAPVHFKVSARQELPTFDAEKLLAIKADPLLQSVRLAALQDRAVEKARMDQSWNALGEGSTRLASTSEVDSLSRIAGVNRLSDGSVNVSLTVTLATASFAELTAAGFAVAAQIGNMVTLETDVERLPSLAALDSVSRITAASRSYPNNDLSRRAIGLDNAAGQRALTQTGRGVIVAFVDDGIDFRHLDFTVPGSNGQQTRIKALLDMTVYNPQASPLPPDPGWNYVLPGSSAPIGRLYTEADINAALIGTGTIQQRNKTGHGTHVAGTAAGNGLAGPQGKYAGMAPEADLIVVKASRQNDGSDNFLDADQLNALAFIQQKALDLNEPFVINMSMAGHVGPHDGTRANERAIDEVVNGGAGRAICVSGGSTGDMHAHASGTVPVNGDLALRLNLRNGTQVLWVSYAKADNISLRVTRADGVQSGTVSYNPNLVPGLSNQYMDVYNTLDDKRDADPQNDQKAMIVILKPGATALGPPPHTWTFTLHGDSITNGQFDSWASLEGDFITNIDDTRQTTIPGTSRGAITVGGYVTRAGDRAIGDYASFTSPGPTADGRQKPDISAPAFSIFSSKAPDSIMANSPTAPDSAFYIGAYGNSFSTPAASGAVALLLQVNRNLTSDQIKSLLSATAVHDSFTGTGWNPRFGNGKLNIAAALNTLVGPGWVPANLSTDQVELQTWQQAGTTYAKVKLTFPHAGYRVQDENWGAVTNQGGSYVADALVEQFTGASIQSVVTTVHIYSLGVLSAGNYSFTFKTNGALAKSVIFTVNNTPPPPNPIDDPQQFVRQQYLDFLGREPDAPGLAFWTQNITQCSDPSKRVAGQSEAECVDRQKETTSGAFFLSPEFQYTGYFVYRMYKGGLGRAPYLAEFTTDRQFVRAGIVVNNQLSGAVIEQNKRNYAEQFVSKPEFKAAFDGLSNQQYVDRLFQNTGINASASDRSALVNGLNGGSESRASVLQKVVDGIRVIAEGQQEFTTTYGQAFYQQQTNPAFVQMEYFGYLRRDPDEAGYAFWLGKINFFGNYLDAQMVRAFMLAPEYRARFGPP